MNTGSCRSDITFLDGEKGILNYRGYAIEELAEKCSFVEVAYLILIGELPTREQLNDFRAQLSRFALVHEDLIHFLIIFRLKRLPCPFSPPWSTHSTISTLK